MAQDFENAIARAQGTTAAAILTSNSDDAIIGIRVANIVSTTIAVDIYIVRSSANYYICKGLSIPPNSSVELIQGGAKVVLVNGDVLYGIADTGNATDVIVSGIDTISA